MLEFNADWRYLAMDDESKPFYPVPRQCVRDFCDLVDRIASQGNRWDNLEKLKGNFASVAGEYTGRSSNVDWAESDLHSLMFVAARNGFLFIEALYDGCENLSRSGVRAPKAEIVNKILQKHNVGLHLDPPKIIVISDGDHIAVNNVLPPSNLHFDNQKMLLKSIEMAQDFIAEQKYRPAVQELLWVLESLFTAYKGVEFPTGRVDGKYFNEITRQLRELSKDRNLEVVLSWVEKMHGYLSAPKGGGVRHGIDLKDGLEIGRNEAILFCDLIKSYIKYCSGKFLEISSE